MSSSPYPVLDNRPIDKWKVTELKEELKRRRLTTRGLKEELVRRLDDALRAEQEDATRAAAEEAHQKSEQEDAALAAAEEAHQKSEQEDATLAAAEEAHQKAELTPLTGGDVILDQKQTIKTTTAVEAALSTETIPAAAETAPEPTEAKTTTAVERTLPSVFLKPEVNDDKVDVKPHEEDMNDGVESGLTASEQNIHKSENKKPFSGLDDGDSKAQQTDAVLEKSATNYQVPEVIPVIGFEVKSDCISTDTVTNNEKIELKDNEIAANFKLEQNVNKSQEPSTVVAESHPMDVEEPLEQKISVGDGDSDAANADMTIENNIIHAGDSEKLNLDRSSGDESMDDEPETKQTESITSSEVVNNSEKSEMLTDKGKTHADNMDTGKSEPPENNIHTLVTSDKRKLPVNEAVGNNEFAKRQRRWNSESVKIPEARATDATNNPIPITTPRSTGLKRDFSRSDSSVSEDGPKERVVPPSLKEPTNSLRIDRFLRPFTLKAVQELLGKTGNVTSFWMDHIKTHCYVSYSSAEEAVATREAVYNLQWPPNGGHLLIAEFVGPEEVKAKLEPPLPPLPQPQSQSPSRPPPTALPPPPPLAKSPPVIEQLPLLPPPPPLVPEEQEPPIVTLDDLFKKTKAIPRIYYLPLSDEQVAAKLAAKNK